MAAPTTIARAEGSVYELIARGNKDNFFFQDNAEAKYLFDNTYTPQAAFTTEMRRIPPRTAAEFGRVVEFDFDLVGDLMRNPTLLLTLPTWLPPSQAALCPKSVITDASGISYGYVNGIAYFLFQQIQFFQDNILLQEFSGDTLWAVSKTQGTYGQGWVPYTLAGEHDGSALSISRNAAPTQLRLELPILGCQGSADPGFPQRACTRHSYRLRCRLRKLEDLIEDSSVNGIIKPNPWSKLFTQRTSSTQTTSFTSLPREKMGPLLLQLETQQVYVTREAQDALQKKPQQLLFKRHFENVFSQNNADYIGILGGGTSPVNRRLDGRHPTARLLWYMRSLDDQHKNRLWKIKTDQGNPYYNSVSLTIAGQTRELPRTPLVWRDIVNHAKEDLDTGTEINTMNFGLGSLVPKRYQQESNSQTTGTINMTTADRPTFYVELANPQSTTPATQLYVITEGWCIFQTDGQGRAELFQMN